MPFNSIFKKRKPDGVVTMTDEFEIAPDETFLDSSNLPEFDTAQFEGRLAKPISPTSIIALGSVFFLVIGLFIWRIGVLQIERGEAYAITSENNRLSHTDLFAERGIIYDRNGVELAWNIPGENPDFASRSYTESPGFGHVLGYISYPQSDASGVYYQTTYSGSAGVEHQFNDLLNGINGVRIVETDALMTIHSQSVIERPVDGVDLELTIDARVQEQLNTFIAELAEERGFDGGAGVIMNVRNGEILALTNVPEYDSGVLSDGEDSAHIAEYVNDPAKPFLNRAVSGLYTPGSTVKPFVAIGALNEGVIVPRTIIESTGSISIPNPYYPDLKTVFTDWKAHGWVDVRKALAMSSNVFFYEVAGGYGQQKGIGIEKLEDYYEAFGLGTATGIDLPNEADGTIPSPEWKAEVFPDDPWRIGDTYFTAIGQYGTQITPVQLARGIAAVANSGVLVHPHVVKGKERAPEPVPIVIPEEHYVVVREGMRQAVTHGTAQGLSQTHVRVAAKTGTAELDAAKKFVNSWTTGFFPYDDPKYVFVIVMEKGPRENLIGGLFVMRQLIDWIAEEAPEYLK